MNLDISSPLAKYAAEHWITHAHSGCKSKSQSSSICSLIMKLLTDEHNAFVNWVRIYDIDRHDVDLLKQRGAIAKPLYYASLAGLNEASYVLSEMKTDITAQGGHFGNALKAPSDGGHEAITKQLIDKGANVNAQGGLLGNALQAASHGGHETIAKLLLEKGAHVNAQGGYYGNALDRKSVV